MYSIALAAAAVALSMPFQEPEPKYTMTTYQFVVLRKGPTAGARLAVDESQRRQAAHVGFLDELLMTGKAVTLGKFSDSGSMLGIVVMAAKTKEEAQACLADDPLLKSGALAIEVRPWLCAKEVFGKFGGEAADTEPLTLGVLLRNPSAPKLSGEEAAKVQEGHMANIRKMAASGDLLAAGPFLEDTPWRGLFIFKTASRERIRELCKTDPTIAGGRLVLELYSILTPKGTLIGPPINGTGGTR